MSDIGSHLPKDIAEYVYVTRDSEHGKTCIAACSGVTFVGDPEGVVKEMIVLLSWYAIMANSLELVNIYNSICAVLSQVLLEPPAAAATDEVRK